MSTADGMNGEASASNVEQNGESLNNCPKRNDCGRHGTLDVGGARPKGKNLVCNIPNGIGPALSDDAAKVNNNVTLPENLVSELDELSASCSGISKLNNGLNFSCANGVENTSGIDSYLHNNVNCHAAVDKCPLKVRSCSNKHNSLDLSNGCYCPESQHGGVTRRWDEADGSSSDTGNEGEDGLSADECCIYTYKGDQMADLPSSFFTLDVLARTGEPGPSGEGARKEDGDVEGRVGDRTSGGSSPEMDFLEMDFDPGPSCEQDSEEDSDCCDIQDEEAAALYPGHDLEPNMEMDCGADSHSHNDPSATLQDNDLRNASASVLGAINTPEEHPTARSTSPQSTRTLPHSRSSDANLGGGTSSTTVRSVCWPPRDSWGRHCTGGDLCSPGETTDMECETLGETLVMWNASNLRVQNEGGVVDTRKYNPHAALYHCIMAKRLLMDKQASFSSDGDEYNLEGQLDGSPEGGQFCLERTMIWSEKEACAKQVTQISMSACGATAAVNVLLACNIPFSLDRVKEGVNTRLRAESAPLPEYLLSRSVAGATHVDIIRGLELASEGSLYGRFFCMYPDRVVPLTRWLAYWMKKGAIPIATLNLQNGIAPGSPVPDAWHHQMVFGVGPRGIYLINPVECVSEAALWPQLCSPSVLLVRRGDVLARWQEDTSLRPLMTHPDHRWKTMNVLGQVVNIIRESTCARVQTQGCIVTQHVTIPAACSSGITLVIRRESPGYEELRCAPELPLLQQQQQ
ncbi:hypothetical protein Cfor_01534 [Coptotermes formosanus]|uniref:Uncharacterized protein n=1 Tax=Coptotermes formosanus TaxID=36987 RepID=A0A6L2PGP5_COPFO|nr:hypothetical protein Cfor_01534 [Coptotermes formosanus]